MDGRLTLARRAVRSLDVQYYHLQNDSVGLQFLRELRDAAGRGVRIRLLVDDLYTGGEDELFRSFAAVPNVEVRLFNPLPSRGGGVGLAHRRLAARVQPHQPADAQQAVHRRQPLLDLRRPQHGRGVLHAKLRGQLHRHGRHRGGTGRPRAVASVRSLLEQQRRLPGTGGRRGDGAGGRRLRQRGALRRAGDCRAARVPAPDERPARPRLGRLRAVGRPHGPALRHGAGLRGHAVQGLVAQPGRHALDGEPQRPGGARDRAFEHPDRLSLLHPRQGGNEVPAERRSPASSASPC